MIAIFFFPSFLVMKRFNVLKYIRTTKANIQTIAITILTVLNNCLLGFTYVAYVDIDNNDNDSRIIVIRNS